MGQEFSLVACLLTLLLTLVIGFYSVFKSRRKNYPPGPWRLPILGNLLSTGDRLHLALERYYKIYGPIFSIKLASEEAVILHGAQLIKEAFKLPSFSGRPDKEAVEVFLSGSKAGIVFGTGKSWDDQRRFAIRQLRELGFGKSSLEGSIMSEVTELMEWIKEQNGKPVSLHHSLSLATVNVLWFILSGKRYHHNDPQLVSIVDQMQTTAGALLGGGIKSLLIFFYPKIAKTYPNWSGWNFLLKSLEPRSNLFAETIAEHEKTFQEGHPRDFIDVYLQEVKNTRDSNSIFHKQNAGLALQSVMADFFLAGSDTTSTYLSWGILYLMVYRDVQNKMRDELTRVVGNSRVPSIADRNNLPYTQAFLMELMRMASIVTFGAPHAVTEDVEFHGFLIPKGTSVYASLYTTHHDPEIWGDPEIFRPERFLNEDGSKNMDKNEFMMPFSIGRRSCIGEALARDQLFLFLTSFVQSFDISFEPGKMPTLEPKYGQITLEPQPYSVVMKEIL